MIFRGEDDSGCDFVAIGGDGVMSVTANVAPRLMHQCVSNINIYLVTIVDHAY